MHTAQSTSDKQRHILWLVLRALITISAIVWLVSELEWQSIIESLKKITWIWLIPAFALYCSFVIPCALRWKVTSRITGFNLSFSDAVYWYFVSDFFNCFLPTGHGGDVVRAGMIARRYNVSFGTVTGSILIERITGVMVAIGCVLAILPFASELSNSKYLIFATGLLAALIVCGMILLYIPLIQKVILFLAKKIPIKAVYQFVHDLFAVLNICKKHPFELILVFILSLINQCFMIGASYLVSFAITGFTAPWYSFIIVTALIFFVVLLPSIGGYGISEAGYVVFFGWFGVNETPAAIFAGIKLIFSLSIALIGGILFCIGFSNAKKGSFYEETNSYPRRRN